jgi:hypothetical protein
MRPAADAAADAARDGADLAQTASAAAGAAALDADQTAEMEPQVGRAGWIGERARGAPDAGAVAWAIFLSGLAEGLTLAARESSAPHNSG